MTVPAPNSMARSNCSREVPCALSPAGKLGTVPGGVSDADFTIGGRGFVIQSYADGLDGCVTGFHMESPPLLFDVDLPLALLDLLVLGSEGSGEDGYVDLDRGLSLGLDFIYHIIPYAAGFVKVNRLRTLAHQQTCGKDPFPVPQY